MRQHDHYYNLGDEDSQVNPFPYKINRLFEVDIAEYIRKMRKNFTSAWWPNRKHSELLIMRDSYVKSESASQEWELESNRL